MTELKFEQLVPLYAAAGKARREAVGGDKKNCKSRVKIFTRERSTERLLWSNLNNIKYILNV